MLLAAIIYGLKNRILYFQYSTVLGFGALISGYWGDLGLTSETMPE
jgi:hypothetical protein